MSFCILSLIAVITIYLSIKCYLHFTYWRRQGLPYRPWIDTSYLSLPPHQFCLDQAAKYGLLHGGYDLFRKYITVNDPTIIQEITGRAYGDFSLRNSWHLGGSSIAKGLFFLDTNADFKRIKSILSPIFTRGKIKAMSPLTKRICRRFVAHLRPYAVKGAQVHIKKYIDAFVMDVLSECSYGIRLDSIETPEHPVLVHSLNIFNNDMPVNFAFCYLFPTLARLLRVEPFNRRSHAYFKGLTEEIVRQKLGKTKETPGDSKKQNKDLFDLMLEHANLPSEPKLKSEVSPKYISMDELFGQGMTFIIGGFDSTHSTFEHLIFYLSRHLAWQEAIYHELLEQGVAEEDFPFETMQRLPKLNAFINETLRLAPPILSFTREASRDCLLPTTKIQVPKGTVISIQPHVLHRQAAYFADPLSFKPERFLDDPALETSPAFIPFGCGQRLCIGKRFALNELRFVLGHLLSQFQVLPGSTRELVYNKGSVVFSPKELNVTLTLR